jgi:Fe2+ transport system protein FeoA
LLPLPLAVIGEYVRIAAIRGGSKCKERLLSIGIQVEDVVRVIQSRPNGAVLIAKGGNRLMLGGGMAQKIFVIKE